MRSNEEILDANQELLQTLKENATPSYEHEENDEVASLKESLKMIDAQTEEIIQKMDALK